MPKMIKQEEIIMGQSNEINMLKELSEGLKSENKLLNDNIQEKNELIESLRVRIKELEEMLLKSKEDLQQSQQECEKLEDSKKEHEQRENYLVQKQQETEQQLKNMEEESIAEKERLENELLQAKSEQGSKKEIETAQKEQEQEAQAYIELINSMLKDDEQLKGRIPVDASQPQKFGEVMKDGVILCKLLNAMLPNTIDPRAINNQPEEEEDMVQNLNMAISGAKSHGCMLGTLSSDDIYNGKNEDDILNIIWEIMRAAMVNNINVHTFPNLLSLKDMEEPQENFMKVSAEEMLVRWMNTQAKQGHSHRTLTNFCNDLQDGEILLSVINALHKQWALHATPTQKIEHAISLAQLMGTPTLLRPLPLANAHSRLGLLFSAQLFNALPTLNTISQDQSNQLQEQQDLDIGDSREERTFRMWINSLSLPNVSYLTNLFQDITDGLVLLRVLDHMQPGCVNWDKVQKNPTHFLQKTANCNIFMEIAKKSLGLQLIAIGSQDILNKNKKLVLAVIWQLMIKDVMKTIGDLKELDLVKWGNERIGTKEPKIKNLKDPNIKNSIFLFNLLSAINPKLIDWSIVQDDDHPESLKSNAQYIISIVRKLGASLFIVWEDIVELKTKMIMTLFASLKTYDSK